jgi:hypothetical protein
LTKLLGTVSGLGIDASSKVESSGAWHLSVGTAEKFDKRLTPSSGWYTVRVLAEGASHGTGSLGPTSVGHQVVGRELQGQENLSEMREQQARCAIYTGFYGEDIVANDAQGSSAFGFLTPRWLSYPREIGAPLPLLSVAGASSSSVLTEVAA